MKKLIPLIFLGLLTVSAAAHSASLKGGYGACISEELFDQFTRAVVSKDENALDYLLKNGCFIMRFQPTDATHWLNRSAGVS